MSRPQRRTPAAPRRAPTRTAKAARRTAADVSAPGVTLAEPRATETVGAGGTAIYGGVVSSVEVNGTLVGPAKWRTFDAMAVNCPTVSASMLFTLGLGSDAAITWTAPDEEPDAVEIAGSWDKILRDPAVGLSQRNLTRSGLMAEWRGFSLVEMTAARRSDGLMGLRLAMRPQKTVERWVPGPDGQIAWVVQRSPQDGSYRPIPRWKLLYSVANALTDSPEGLGLLRLLVQAVEALWRFEQLEGVGADTNMAGVPVCEIPLAEIDGRTDLTDAEKAALKAPFLEIISKHVRAADQGYIVDSEPWKAPDGTPSNVARQKITILRGDSSAMGPMHTTITRKKHEITTVCGTEFLLVGSDGGSLALSEAKLAAAIKLVNGALEDFVQALNRDLRPFLAINNGWPLERCPVATVEKLSMKNAAEVAAAMRDWYTARAQMPANDPATNVFRAHLGFPPEPEEAAAELDAMMQPSADPEDMSPLDPAEEPAPVAKRVRRKR